MRRSSLSIAVVAVILMTVTVPVYSFGRVIAVMMSSEQPRYREAHRAFVKSMAARGYGAPGTEIILQIPNSDPLSWSNTVRKFNAYRPDLIVAYGAPAALTAFRESDGIPVVSADVFAAEQPQKGMCGVSSRVPMVTLLKTVQGIRPYRSIGVLFSSREAGSQRQLEDVRKYSTSLGLTVVEGNVATPAQLEATLNSMLEKVDVLLASESSIVSSQFDRIVALAKSRRMPVVATMPDAAAKGALVSLEISPQEQGHLAAEMASRILEGAKSENLSLLSPRRVDLIINMRVAREMGVEIPFIVLGTATRLIK